MSIMNLLAFISRFESGQALVRGEGHLGEDGAAADPHPSEPSLPHPDRLFEQGYRPRPPDEPPAPLHLPSPRP